MPYPSKPSVAYDYSAFEQALGDGSFPGQQLDVDLGALVTAQSALIDFLKASLRADGKLANGSVTADALAASVRIGFDPPAPWAAGVAYDTRSTVFSGYGFYLCLIAHTSGDFNTDLTSGRWQLLADLTPPTPSAGALLSGNNLSDLGSVTTARTNLGLGSMALAVAGSGATQYRNNNAQDALYQPLLGLGFRTVTASETATTADLGRTLLVDTTAAAVTVTLPPAASCGPGKPWIQFVRIGTGSNALTIDPNASETIMGGTTMLVQNKWDAIIIQSDGTDWYVVSAHYFTSGFGKTVINKADAASMRTQLGLGTVATLASVLAASGIAANNNDASVPTSAAVAAYAAPKGSFGTEVSTTSGVNADFSGIPSTARKIEVLFMGVSTNGSSPLQVQLGDSRGVLVTGYQGGASQFSSSGATSGNSSGFLLQSVGAAGNVYWGSMTLFHAGGNRWVQRFTLNTGTASYWGSGYIAQGAVVDRLRVTTVNGTDTFDLGSIQVFVE